MNYYEVIFPSLNSPKLNIFTYSSKIALQNGDFIQAELRNKIYRGIILKKVKKPSFKTKEATLIEPKLLEDWQLKLFEFINNYYFSSPVKTINLFLPKKIFNSKKLKFQKEEIKNTKNESKKHKLNESQEKIFKKILKKNEEMHLIHGVTGSGKTEIYLHLSSHHAKKGHQTLILVPEISLTPQTGAYFKNYFGEENVSLWHSKMNETEKFTEWIKIKNNQSKIIIGSRSSIFLPFQNLKQIIVDEEHDYAYKQDQMPRYHARTIAQWYNSNLKTTVIFGSATPSLETYKAALDKKINLHEIQERASKLALPTIKIIDRKDEYAKGNFLELSDYLQDEIEDHLKQKEQIVILHNKRGYASFMQCQDCGHVIKCPRCSISLTLHRKSDKESLKCHYCDYKTNGIPECQNCGSHELRNVGTGIQKVMDNLQTIYPKAKLLRADADTTSRKHAFDEIYQKFKNHEADILIGTQMIAKGMDIKNVQLASVINADIGLHLPDFRSPETTFQLLTQLAGRAGRTKKQGHVVIQTFDPENPVIKAVAKNKIKDFYAEELENRKKFNYPPYAKLTLLAYAHKDKSKVKTEVEKIEKALTQLKIKFKSAPALIEKRHNKFYHNILLVSLTPEKFISRLKLDLNWKIDRDPINTI